jgi:hypothetical protein
MNGGPARLSRPLKRAGAERCEDADGHDSAHGHADDDPGDCPVVPASGARAGGLGHGASRCSRKGVTRRGRLGLRRARRGRGGHHRLLGRLRLPTRSLGHLEHAMGCIGVGHERIPAAHAVLAARVVAHAAPGADLRFTALWCFPARWRRRDQRGLSEDIRGGRRSRGRRPEDCPAGTAGRCRGVVPDPAGRAGDLGHLRRSRGRGRGRNRWRPHARLRAGWTAEARDNGGCGRGVAAGEGIRTSRPGRVGGWCSFRAASCGPEAGAAASTERGAGGVGRPADMAGDAGARGRGWWRGRGRGGGGRRRRWRACALSRRERDGYRGWSRLGGGCPAITLSRREGGGCRGWSRLGGGCPGSTVSRGERCGSRRR